MLIIILTIIHVIVCLFLVIVVLLQSGKAADLAGAFGGMGSQTAFGPRGSATVLTKATTIAAGLFMVTSLTLSVMGTRNGGTVGGSQSVLDKLKTPASSTPPAGAPAPTPGSLPPSGGPVPSVTLTDPDTGREKTMPIDTKILSPEELKKVQEDAAKKSGQPASKK